MLFHVLCSSVLAAFSQYLQKTPFEDHVKLTSEVTDFAKACAADESAENCGKSLVSTLWLWVLFLVILNNPCHYNGETSHLVFLNYLKTIFVSNTHRWVKMEKFSLCPQFKEHFFIDTTHNGHSVFQWKSVTCKSLFLQFKVCFVFIEADRDGKLFNLQKALSWFLC